jgi:ribosomal protein S6
MIFGWKYEHDVKTWGDLGWINYIINKQLGGGYYLVKIKAFRANLRKDT